MISTAETRAEIVSALGACTIVNPAAYAVHLYRSVDLIRMIQCQD